MKQLAQSKSLPPLISVEQGWVFFRQQRQSATGTAREKQERGLRKEIADYNTMHAEQIQYLRCQSEATQASFRQKP